MLVKNKMWLHAYESMKPEPPIKTVMIAHHHSVILCEAATDGVCAKGHNKNTATALRCGGQWRYEEMNG